MLPTQSSKPLRVCDTCFLSNQKSQADNKEVLQDEAKKFEGEHPWQGSILTSCFTGQQDQ